MVKTILLFIALLLFNTNALASDSSVVDDKIQNLVNSDIYKKNRQFIDVITTPKSEFVKEDGSANTLKIIKILKDNGILKLFFKTPKELNINFKTSSNPNFFIKVMNDSLINIGYYKYITQEASYDGDGFIWRVSLVSEYATDPVVLNEELKKSGSKIVDVIRISDTEWTYIIDMKNARLSVVELSKEDEYALKRSLYAHWLDVRGLSELKISSFGSNSWYPYIAYYDISLNLIKVQKVDVKTQNLSIEIEPSCAYIKISDIYSLKNIKEDLILKPVR